MLEKITDFEINPKSEVKVTYMGNVIEKVYLSHKNDKATIQRLPNDMIMVVSSGEIKPITHMENRLDDKKSLRMTMKRLRNLLNANIDDVTKCRWVTLTYAENMTDTKRLYSDFKKFNMRLRYQYGKYEYIVAMEPQGRGAWHAHVVLIFDHTAPFIPNETLKDIWGHGYVTIKKLDDVDNVGAYLTAYLGDMEINEAIKNGYDVNTTLDCKEIVYADENGEKQSKYYIKGGRLHLYPPKFNLYRFSRGVKKPIEEYMTEREAIKKVSVGALTFHTSHLYSDIETAFQCVIDKQYYNIKRGPKQATT